MNSSNSGYGQNQRGAQGVAAGQPQPFSSNQQQRQSLASEKKPGDYVYFERNPSTFSKDTIARTTAAKMKLELYYKVAVESAIERNNR